MSAGMVSVPAIVPLKMPGLGATGSRKWSIDSKTLIEMHSSTKGCIIFYTLDGTKPDPFKRIGEKTTYQYTSPITLIPGKRTLKAMAILRDGSKESNVNTKVFQVSEAVEEEEEERKSSMNTTWKKNVCDSDEDENIDPRVFKKVMKSSEEKTPPQKKDPIRKILIDESFENGSFRQENNFLKEAEYLLCPYCDEPRPADPYARFCNACNSILPPAPGRIRSSQQNNFSFQNALRSSIGNTRQKVECKNCGTSNPNDASQCLVCDNNLINSIKLSKLKKDTAPEPSKNFIICPFCTRVNSGDAKFCDWCGEKSNTKSRTISCQRCTADNLVSSQYCCSCGKNIPAPPRESLEKVLEDGTVKIKETNKKSEGNLEFLQSITNEQKDWKSIEFESVTRKESKNVALQVGDSLIIPMEKVSLKGPMKISPGKGYWRQQVDYVSQHFKVYTQNNIPFREQFSNQNLSTLISASLNESDTEKNAKELVLLFSTPEEANKAKPKKKRKNSINSGGTLINALKTTSRPSSARSSRPSSAKSYTGDAIDSARSSVNGSRPSSARKQKMSKKALEKEKQDAFYAKLSKDTKKLLNMVKASKSPDVEEFESLLDSEDIDINVVDENGLPALTLAVQNKNFDLIQPLIIAGVDIDAVSGSKLTTALHEAVLLGICGKEAVGILLDNDASYSIKDQRGKSAHDVAVDYGFDIILSVFNQHMSKGLLNDVMKL